MRNYKLTGTFTESMENRIYDHLDLESEDPENYRDQLMEIVHSFRSLDQLLEELLIWKGFSGEQSDLNGKLAYARMLFITKGIPVPRNLRSFLDGTSRFDRDKKTPFQFCLAFGLTLEETESFFRRACLGRGVDYHSMQDLVFAYAIREKLSYEDVCRLLEQLPDVEAGKVPEAKSDQQGCMDFEEAAGQANGILREERILYTNTIKESFDDLQSSEELLFFLKEHADQFAWNNVTGIRTIQKLWGKLNHPSEGLLNRELIELSDPENDPAESEAGKKKWGEEAVLKQILGLRDASLYRDFSNKRSLKEILKNNPLLHPLAADCFPNRNAVRNILDGKHVSYESVRKLLILLLFYQYWIKKALDVKKHNENRSGDQKKNVWLATGDDGDRCQNYMDRHLVDAGYPELYYGNPYDWLFLYAMVNEEPLTALRGFMQELYLEIKDRADE